MNTLSRKPNVLLFLTDDHAAWAMGHAGSVSARTPNLDRLAVAGTRFINATTPSPVCSPARASLMTGLMPSEHGIHDWLQEYDPETGDHNWLNGIRTIPDVYLENNYYTGLSGKWHLGFNSHPPSGFEWAFGLDRIVNTHLGTSRYYLNGEPRDLNGNRSRLITDNAINFLRSRPVDRPFFLNVGYFATHSPFEAHKHDPESLSPFMKEDFPDMPRKKAHPWSKPENGIPGVLFDEMEARKRWRGYFSGVWEVDQGVGRILAHLEEKDLLKDTIIIYTADHGLCLGHHGIWGKGNATRPLNMYEENLKVPLIISGPGFKANDYHFSPVTHCDVFHLLADIGQGKCPSEIYSQLCDKSDYLDRPTFHEYGDMRAIRTREFKLIRRFHHGPDQLFDLSADPQETTNVISRIPYQDILRRLDLSLDDFFRNHTVTGRDGREVARMARHNDFEAWRDGLRDKALK